MPTGNIIINKESKENTTALISGILHEKYIGYHNNGLSNLTEDARYDLLCNSLKPDQNFNGSKQRFGYKCLDTFNVWLAYSAALDRAFCINCMLFGGDSNHNSSKLNCLFKAPFSDLAKATVRFNDHCTRFHKIATLRATQFCECMENREVSIDVMMHSQISEQVRLNREKQIPIVEVVILCDRKNISLRGHTDDLEYLQTALNNPGNL